MKRHSSDCKRRAHTFISSWFRSVHRFIMAFYADRYNNFPELNHPRQSRGLISVSPSKGPLNSALKGAGVPADPNASHLNYLAPARKRDRHSGGSRNPGFLISSGPRIKSGVTTRADAILLKSWIRSLFFLATPAVTSAHGQTFGSPPAKPGVYRLIISSKPVNRAADAMPALVQHMGVDNGRAEVFVGQKLSDRSDVVPCVEQVRGKGMPESVAGCALSNAGPCDGIFHWFPSLPIQIG